MVWTAGQLGPGFPTSSPQDGSCPNFTRDQFLLTTQPQVLGCYTGSSWKELVSNSDCTMPERPPSTRSFPLLPCKERSQRTKVPFAGMSTHGMSSREPYPLSPLFLSILALEISPNKACEISWTSPPALLVVSTKGSTLHNRASQLLC